MEELMILTTVFQNTLSHMKARTIHLVKSQASCSVMIQAINYNKVTCMQVRKQQLELDMEQQTGSK